jgi:hypothetical protein
MLSALKASLPFLQAERMRSGPSIALAFGWSECGAAVYGGLVRETVGLKLPSVYQIKRGKIEE